MKRYICRYSAIAAGVLMCAASAFAQKDQSTKNMLIAAGEATPITLVGCLQSESDYRRQYHEGRGGRLDLGIGLGNEYVLVNAVKATDAAARSVDCAVLGTGEAYELTGRRERNKYMEAFVGRPVQVTGILKRAKMELEAVGTSGAIEPEPTGGFDPIGHDLKLREVNVRWVEEAHFGAPAATTARAAEPAAPGEPAPQPAPIAGTAQPAQPAPAAEQQTAAAETPKTLPRTASPRALSGLIGLLSLAGALTLRWRRRHA